MKILNLKSFRTSIFLIIFFSCLFSLTALSLVTLKAIESHSELFLEKNLVRYSIGSETIYNSNLDILLKLGLLVSRNPMLIESIEKNDTGEIQNILKTTSELGGIDIATVVDSNAKVIARINSDNKGDILSMGGVVPRTLKNKIPTASAEIISTNELINENPETLLDVRIRRIPTLYQVEDNKELYQTDGIVHTAIIPLVKEDKVIGALVLADILNRDNKIPDQIKKTLDLEVSIFQGDVRVSTTIKTNRNNRFIGTLLSQPAVNKTIKDGDIFVGRTWTVNQWGRAVYIPIKNHNKDVIGALGISINENQFQKSRFLFGERNLSTIVILTSLLLIFISFIISYFMSKKLIKPINKLINSAIEVSKGNFDQGVQVNSYEEINKLADTFNVMIRFLRKQMVKKERQIIKEAKKIKDEDK